MSAGKRPCGHFAITSPRRAKLDSDFKMVQSISSPLPLFYPLLGCPFSFFSQLCCSTSATAEKRRGKGRKMEGGGAVAITGMYPSVRGLPNLGAENTPPTPPPKINLQHFLDPFGCLSHKVWSIPRTGREIHSGSYDNSTTAWRFALWDSKVCILSPTADRQEIFQIVRFNHLFTFKYVN